MPAAAVTPAPGAYSNVAAVKKLVVGKKGNVILKSKQKRERYSLSISLFSLIHFQSIFLGDFINR